MKTELGTYTSRAIEFDMANRVARMSNWHLDNTEVAVHRDAATQMPCADVFLFGNHIATLIQDRHDHLSLMVNVGTLRAYPTRTTLSRLRALGANVRTRKGVVYLDERAIN